MDERRSGEAKEFFIKHIDWIIMLGEIVAVFFQQISRTLYILVFIFMIGNIIRYYIKYKIESGEIQNENGRKDMEYRSKFKILKDHLGSFQETDPKIVYINKRSETSVLADMYFTVVERYFWLIDRHIDRQEYISRKRIEAIIYIVVLGAWMVLHSDHSAWMIAYAKEGIVYVFDQLKQEEPDRDIGETMLSEEDSAPQAAETTAPEQSSTDNVLPTEAETKAIAEDIEWSQNFILADPAAVHTISERLEGEVFYPDGVEVESWFSQKFIYSDDTGSEEEDTSKADPHSDIPAPGYLSELEETFLKDSDRAKRAGSEAEWRRLAPRSEILDLIIDGREKIAEASPTSSIYWLLANDHQRYALEYQIQNGDGRTILYYYCKSIQSIYRAMRYIKNDESKKQKMYQYLKARYQDIADQAKIGSSYREKAQTIVDVMD